MPRNIAEFITEQENSTYGITEDKSSLERTYVESMIAFSTATCYLEQAAFVAYADECGIDSVSVMQESGDEKKDTKKNIFKRAGNAIVNAWKWFVTMLKEIWKKIRGKFKKEKTVTAAKQFESIFDQFKKNYPEEVTDEMSSADFFKFVAVKWPDKDLKITIKDLETLYKYNRLRNAMERTNKWLKDVCDAQDPLKVANASAKDAFNATRAGSVKNEFVRGNMADSKEVASKDLDAIPMAEVFNMVAEIKNNKSVDELSVEGQGYIDKLQRLFDEQTKKSQTEAQKNMKSEDDEAAKNNKMADISSVMPVNSTTSDATDTAKTIEYLRNWVNTLTKIQVELDKDFDETVARLSRMAKKISEMPRNEAVTSESFYFV